MAERKQVNRYYPPDFDPAKHKSINKYRNSHPLRERAKKLSQGILVIRFEMPYNIWCGGCGNHIGMGVRYNAEKKKVGNYYTTPIYHFKMKCHLCDNYIEMETDPKNFDYTITSGAQRKNQKWDMAENEQVLTEDREAVKKLARDAMYKLEHGVDDTKKLKKAAPSLSKIAEIQSAKKEDYNQNQRLRSKFRAEKKQLLEVEASDKALLAKSSLDIDLVPEAEEDKRLAALLKFSAPETYEEKRQQKRVEIQNRGIFASSTVSSPPDGDPSPKSTPSSKSSPGSKHLEAQKTLMTKVLKNRGGGVFGSFGGHSLASTSSSGRTAKVLIGGKQGLVVTRKRKRSSDPLEEFDKKRSKRPSDDVTGDRDFKGRPCVTSQSATISAESCRTDGGDRECKADSKPTMMSSETSIALECAVSFKSETTLAASETEQLDGCVDIVNASKEVEALSPNAKRSDGTGDLDSGDDLLVTNASSGVDDTRISSKDRLVNTSPKSSPLSTSHTNEQTRADSEPSAGQTTGATNDVSESSRKLSEQFGQVSSRETEEERHDNAKCNQSSLSLVSCYSSSSESEND